MAFSSTSNNSNKTTTATTLNDSMNSTLNASQSVLNTTKQSLITGNSGEDLLPKLKTLVSLEDDWIAVKSLSKPTNPNNDNNSIFVNKNDDEIINIVSISVEKEKVNRIKLRLYMKSHLYV